MGGVTVIAPDRGQRRLQREGCICVTCKGWVEIGQVP